MYNSDGQLAQIQNGNETIKIYGYTAESNLLANYLLGLFKQKYGYDD